MKEFEVTLETWIVSVANLLISNYNVVEYHAYIELRHG
jgi:hypothetical protein